MIYTKGRKSLEKTIRRIRSDSIGQMVEDALRSSRPETVAELFRSVREDDPSVTREEVVEAVQKLRDDEEIELELPPPQARSYFQYLAVRSENLWLYSVMATCFFVLAAVYAIPKVYPLVVFRWIVGSILVLFLPGFVVVQALFIDGRELEGVERLALSVGLSIAIAPLIGLLLNYSPWGVRLDPIVTSLVMFTISIAIVAAYRRYRATLDTQYSHIEC